MAHIKTETATISFSRLVKSEDDESVVVTDEDMSALVSFVEVLNDTITDGRIVEIDL